MRKLFVPAFVAVVLFAACNPNNTNTNVTPPVTNNNNNTTPPATVYYVKAKLNGTTWDNTGAGCYWQKTYTGSDTDLYVNSQANYSSALHSFSLSVPGGNYTGVGTYTGNDVHIHFQQAATIDYTKIFDSEIGDTSCVINVTYDDGTMMKGTFRGKVMNNNTPTDDTIKITNGDFVVKKL